MQRVPNWDVELVRFAGDMQGRPFRYGSTDCGTLVRGALKAMYGKDVLRGMGSYRLLRDARKLAKSVGPIPEYLKVTLGCKRIRRNFVQAGDIVVLPGEDRRLPQLGVVVGGKLMVSDVELGVQIVPLPTGHWPRGSTILRVPHQ